MFVVSPSRLEDEMVLRRSQSESWSLGEAEELKGSRRGSGSARRSFFRRRRHQRNNSKDSRDLGGSFSDASLNSESVPILDGEFNYDLLVTTWQNQRWLAIAFFPE
jgi:hypothetical protein